MKHLRNGFIINTRDDARQKGDIDVIRCVLEADGYKLSKFGSLIIPKIIVDIGGHIGSFALKAKSVWKDAKIIAFEPNLKNAELYQQNIIDNKLSDVKIYSDAISYEKNKTILTDGPRATGGGFLCTEERASKDLGVYYVSRSNLSLLTLEEAMTRENIDHIDLLKIDCEGSEREIINQMREETANKIGLIVGEYHIDGGYPKFEELFYSKFHHLTLIRTRPDNDGKIGEFLAVPKDLLKYF